MGTGSVEGKPSYQHVLIVEDDTITATVAREMCKALGCLVTVATNGMQALEQYQQHAIDLIFMDLQMPHMGGYEAAYEIRQIEKDENRPPVAIVAVSGAMERDTRVRCMQSGMDGCAEKPYTMAMVRLALESYIDGFIVPEKAVEATASQSKP